MRASTACRLPTCLWSRPDFARMKISQSGQSCFASLVMAGSSGGAGGGRPLRGEGGCGLAHPAAVLVRAAPRLEALAVARAVAGEHQLELGPVDRAEAVVLRRLVPGERRVRHREAEVVGLRDRRVDELL